VCAEFGYPKDLQTPSVKGEIRHYHSQLFACLNAHANERLLNVMAHRDNRRLASLNSRHFKQRTFQATIGSHLQVQ
jgi:hypothetical protein